MDYCLDTCNFPSQQHRSWLLGRRLELDTELGASKLRVDPGGTAQCVCWLSWAATTDRGTRDNHYRL